MQRSVAISSPFVALSHTTASWPARRKARESDANVLASSSTIRSRAFCGTATPLLTLSQNLLDLFNTGLQFIQIAWKFNPEGRPSAR